MPWFSKNEPTMIVIVPTFTKGSILNNEITEDQVGALLIAREFSKLGIKLESETLEEIQLLEEKMKTNSIEEILLATKHGQKLINLGFKTDIEFCSRLNFTSVIPISENETYSLSNTNRVVIIT